MIETRRIVALATIGVMAALTLVIVLLPQRTPPPYVQKITAADMAPTRQRAVLWVGDSYTASAGASEAANGYVAKVSANLGWVPLIDAQGGTGFVNDARPDVTTAHNLPDRLAQVAAQYRPDAVVVDAGRNDHWFPPQKVQASCTGYLRRIHAAYPKVPVVVVVPSWINPGADRTLAKTADAVRACAKTGGATVIDPAREGWLPARSANMIASDGIHPSDVGHGFYTERLTRALGRMKWADGVA